MALQTLREDYSLSNLCEHDSLVPAPSSDVMSDMRTARDAGHVGMTHWLDIFILRALPSFVAPVPDLIKYSGME